MLLVENVSGDLEWRLQQSRMYTDFPNSKQATTITEISSHLLRFPVLANILRGLWTS